MIQNQKSLFYKGLVKSRDLRNAQNISQSEVLVVIVSSLVIFFLATMVYYGLKTLVY